MMPYIEALAQAVKGRYAEVGRVRSRFPQVACRCLEEAGLHERLAVSDVLAWLSSAADIGRQFDMGNTFGDPPLTLWHDSDFRIEVYFWLTTQTTIHDHRFSGAFQVMVGRTLHTHFKYAVDETVGDFVTFGEIERRTGEIMSVGDVRPILGGPRMIHQALHLSTPTVSLIVRTHLEAELLYQWRYWRPAMATATTVRDDLLSKRLAMLRFLAQGGREHVDTFVGDLVRSDDPYQLFHTLKEHWELFHDRDRLESLLGQVGQRHGGWAERLALVLTDSEVSGEVKWPIIHDEGQKFLAGLMTTCPDRPTMEPLISQFAPDQPAPQAIGTWLEGLLQSSALDVELDAPARALLPAALRGASPNEALAANPQTYDRLLRHPVLKPLFTRAAA